MGGAGADGEQADGGDQGGIDVWNRKILAHSLLGVDDAEERVTARLNELFPDHAGTAGIYLVEHDYLSQPVTALPSSDPDALTAWNTALEETGA
ncbi:hypothetical protein [Streptomyces sp. NPDC001410]|uniref:hypothetical protein n=1 Tax=Streptomyces sp. NPDC001410 TaxID=3364574 RepID=UPI0036C8329C